MNHSLDADITCEEVISTLSSFKKVESPGPNNNLTVEFFWVFFYLMKDDLVTVVQESMSLGKVKEHSILHL
jgi:hypothetical protein